MELFSLKHHHSLLIGLFLLSLHGCDSETQTAPTMIDAEMTSPCARACTADSDGHQCCLMTFGETFFCSSALRCIEMAVCDNDMETDLCCQPGSAGDEECAEQLGEGSYCEPGVEIGTCSAVSAECPACESNNEGHACCQDAQGPNAYCGGEGTCLEAQPCSTDNPECCIPGVSGDAQCVENFGPSSQCQQRGAGFRCSMSSPPPCAGCIPDNEGHQCCQDARGEAWYCSLEQICRQTSGCTEPQCCVPGEAGEARCIETFGDDSRCEIVDGEGRCTQP